MERKWSCQWAATDGCIKDDGRLDGCLVGLVEGMLLYFLRLMRKVGLWCFGEKPQFFVNNWHDGRSIERADGEKVVKMAWKVVVLADER